jgi:hypothetical protein
MGRPTWMVGRIESVSNSQRIGRLIIPEGYRTIICGLVIGRTVLDIKAQPCVFEANEFRLAPKGCRLVASASEIDDPSPLCPSGNFIVSIPKFLG